MPALVAAIAEFFIAGEVAGAVASELTLAGFAAESGALIAAADIAGTAAGVVAAVGVSIAISAALAEHPAGTPDSGGFDATARGALINTASTVEPIQVLYGRRRVGGAFFLRQVFGDANQFFGKGIVIGEGPIQDVQNIYFDDTLASDARFSGKYYLEPHAGADDQAASAVMQTDLPDTWSAAHTGSGIAYLYARLTFDGSVWHGEPKITMDVLGRTLYDPRDGSTRFSNNVALAVRDYLTHPRYGRGIATAAINDASFIESANHCDERVAVPNHAAIFVWDPVTALITFPVPVVGTTPQTGTQIEIFGLGDGVTVSSDDTLPNNLFPATMYYVIPNLDNAVQLAASYANALARISINVNTVGSGIHTMLHVDQARYSCDGLVNVDQASLQNLPGLLSACRGFLVFSGGQYKLKIEKAEAPSSFGFNEDNIMGAWQIQLPGKRQLNNRVRARFFNPALGWQEDIAVFESTAYRALDNGLLLESEMELPFTADLYRSQRIAQMVCQQSRFGIVAQFHATIAGLRAEVGDVVPITHSTPGWVAKLFRVTDMELLSNDEVQVTVREYDASVFTTTQVAMRATPATNLPDPSVVGVPGILSVIESLYQTTGSAGVKSRATVTWSAPPDVFVTSGGRYQFEYADHGSGNWELVAITQATSATKDDCAPGIYDYRVKAVNVAGFASAYSSIFSQEQHGLTAPPSNMTGFGLTPFVGQAQLSWDKMVQNSDLDVLIGGRIMVRYSPKTAGAGWNDGVEIANVAGDSTGVLVPLMSGTYMARAQDSSGNQSTGIVSVITTAPDVDAFNAVASLTEDPTFTGARANTIVTIGMLQLNGSASVGTYDFSTYIDLGAVYTSRVLATLKTLAFEVADLIDARLDPIDAWGLIDGAEISDVNAQLFVATTNTDPAGAPAWSAWQPFLIGDYKARAFKFRLVLETADLSHNVSVINLGVSVDMPDREDGARDIASGAGVKTVNYTLTPVFKALPHLGVTGKNMATGDYFTINNEQLASFDIVFRNAAAAAVNRTFDWRAKGY